VEHHIYSVSLNRPLEKPDWAKCPRPTSEKL
jgi:hypothetical protein